MYKNMREILFNPGGSELSLFCPQGLQLKKKAFGYRSNQCKNRTRNKKKDEIDETILVTEQKYNPKVLVGNWYEERLSQCPCPCTAASSSSETDSGNDAAGYNNKLTTKFTTFEAARKNKEKNRGLGANLIAPIDGNKYLENYTTSYDLMYRVVPQNLDGPIARTYNSRVNKWLPQPDFTENYGNVTGYGMKEYVKALQEYALYESTEKPRTHYQCAFQKKEIPVDIKRFHRKKVDLNKPDWSGLDDIDGRLKYMDS